MYKNCTKSILPWQNVKSNKICNQTKKIQYYYTKSIILRNIVYVHDCSFHQAIF